MRLLRVVVVLVLLAVAGLAAYAYFGDMTPQRREIRVPVSLDGAPLPDAAAQEGPAADGEPAEATAAEAADTDAPAAGADVLD